MSFGGNGEHRNHRTGGTHQRKKGEIFANAFQGKLAECAIYNQFYNELDITEPDFETYGLGEWDDADFYINDFKISIKSTKSFGNLLLLETRDWNRNRLNFSCNKWFFKYNIRRSILMQKRFNIPISCRGGSLFGKLT